MMKSLSLSFLLPLLFLVAPGSAYAIEPINQVPEPTTLLLLGSALIAVAWFGKMLKK